MFFSELLFQKYGIKFNHFLLYSVNASKKYFRFTIPKKDGTQRNIYHPSKELKHYQKILNECIFSKLPTHEAVFSYRKKLSTHHMLAEHNNNNYILRIDFKDFFPSIKNYYIRTILQKHNDLNTFDFNLNELDITAILNIVCRNNCLSIGSITSPQISNILLYDFDNSLSNYCISHEITYTRYADDLFFSTKKPNILSSIYNQVDYILKDLKLNNLKINNTKTIKSSKKHNRTMTGLVITSENKISIGLKKKLAIKKDLYALKQGKNIDLKQAIGGFLSYIKSVEPEFFNTLKRKYGSEFIDQLVYFKY